MSRATSGVVALVLIVLALLRFAYALNTAVAENRGDFYHTIPGPYVERLNPRLWDSPDLAASRHFHRHTYWYGPTQYLTLAPLMLLDSYRSIANVLLVLYAACIALTIVILWKTVSRLDDRIRTPHGAAAVAASVLLFFPLLQALAQREFEVFIVLVVCLATYGMARGRDALAGALLAYASLFKLWPVVFAPYLVARRRQRAAVAFVAVAVLELAVTGLLLGFDAFASDMMAIMPLHYLRQSVDAARFCADIPATGTLASVRAGLCAVSSYFPVIPPGVAFRVIAAASAATIAIAFVRLSRTGRTGDDPWRTVLEVSLIVMAAATFAHAHYYYYAFLVLPITVLLAAYISRSQWWRLTILAALYLLLNALLLPPSVWSRMLGVPFWDWYMGRGIYLWGSLGIWMLLLAEYVALSRRPAALAQA